jgi:uncharacterized protein with HEPN domain
MQRDLLLITEMIAAATQAQELVAGRSLHDLEGDRQRRDALLWNVTVLGEAATQLGEQTKASFPDIPWQRPAQLRNRIVHGYWSIDLEVVHTVATDVLPGLILQLDDVRRALESQPPGSQQT